ncbi:MAG: SEC-C metal-binding domain-containing protein [Armatimonadota bacterium]
MTVYSDEKIYQEFEAEFERVKTTGRIGEIVAELKELPIQDYNDDGRVLIGGIPWSPVVPEAGEEGRLRRVIADKLDSLEAENPGETCELGATVKPGLWEVEVSKNGAGKSTVYAWVVKWTPDIFRACIHHSLPELFPPTDDLEITLRVRVPQDGSQDDVGRNDPCPCGSGKKYKHCCLP